MEGVRPQNLGPIWAQRPRSAITERPAPIGAAATSTLVRAARTYPRRSGGQGVAGSNPVSRQAKHPARRRFNQPRFLASCEIRCKIGNPLSDIKERCHPWPRGQTHRCHDHVLVLSARGPHHRAMRWLSRLETPAHELAITPASFVATAAGLPLSLTQRTRADLVIERAPVWIGAARRPVQLRESSPTLWLRRACHLARAPRRADKRATCLRLSAASDSASPGVRSSPASGCSAASRSSSSRHSPPAAHRLEHRLTQAMLRHSNIASTAKYTEASNAELQAGYVGMNWTNGPSRRRAST